MLPDNSNPAVLQGPSTRLDNDSRLTTTSHFPSGSPGHPQPHVDARGGREEGHHLQSANIDDADEDASSDGETSWHGIGSADDGDGDETMSYAAEASDKFPMKLFRLLSTGEYKDVCDFFEKRGERGVIYGLRIWDEDRFADTAMKAVITPKSEKGDVKSFFRQLKRYNFEQCGRKQLLEPTRTESTWCHPNFQRGKPELARGIGPKRPNAVVEAIGQDTIMQEPDVEVPKLRSEPQEQDRKMEELKRTNEALAKKIDHLEERIRILESSLSLPSSSPPNPSSTGAFLVQDPAAQAYMSRTDHVAHAVLRAPQNASCTINPAVLSCTIPDELELQNGVHRPDDIDDGAYLSGAPFPPPVLAIRNDMTNPGHTLVYPPLASPFSPQEWEAQFFNFEFAHDSQTPPPHSSVPVGYVPPPVPGGPTQQGGTGSPFGFLSQFLGGFQGGNHA